MLCDSFASDNKNFAQIRNRKKNDDDDDDNNNYLKSILKRNCGNMFGEYSTVNRKLRHAACINIQSGLRVVSFIFFRFSERVTEEFLMKQTYDCIHIRLNRLCCAIETQNSYFNRFILMRRKMHSTVHVSLIPSKFNAVQHMMMGEPRYFSLRIFVTLMVEILYSRNNSRQQGRVWESSWIQGSIHLSSKESFFRVGKNLITIVLAQAEFT